MLPGTTFYFVHLNAVCIHDYRVSSQSLRSEREGSHVSAPWTGTWQLRSLTWRGHCWKITLVKTGKRLYPLWSSHIAPEQTARYHSISHSTCRYAVSTKVKFVRYTGVQSLRLISLLKEYAVYRARYCSGIFSLRLLWWLATEQVRRNLKVRCTEPFHTALD